jgi:hypothetical protein
LREESCDRRILVSDMRHEHHSNPREPRLSQLRTNTMKCGTQPANISLMIVGKSLSSRSRKSRLTQPDPYHLMSSSFFTSIRPSAVILKK